MANDFPRSYIRALLAEDEAQRDKAAALYRPVTVEVAEASVTAIDDARVRLREPVEDTSWRERAACLDMPANLFYAGPHENDVAANAREVCASCPVAGECLEFALVHDERFGIWGGTSERERRRLRRLRRSGAA
jgi:WhiB family redox-sensing transcriptional regulator